MGFRWLLGSKILQESLFSLQKANSSAILDEETACNIPV